MVAFNASWQHIQLIITPFDHQHSMDLQVCYHLGFQTNCALNSTPCCKFFALQGRVPSITLLLPQDSSGFLGHAAMQCTASHTNRGLTCLDVLTAIHSFYQQEVLLQPAAAACGSDWQLQPQLGRAACSTVGVMLKKRLQLLGTRLLFEGLVRATRDPHSIVYEVCLA